MKTEKEMEKKFGLSYVTKQSCLSTYRNQMLAPEHDVGHTPCVSYKKGKYECYSGLLLQEERNGLAM